ncbi:MAG: hypothetical protein GC151_00690 [Betaproteobacteria bacterium]|nr:hypothetical protein [Betaproteobacteria bacterium]
MKPIPVPRRVPPRHGWLWVLQGWRLFLRKPLTWIVFTVVTWLIVWASSKHLMLMAAVAILLPVLLAGWTMACVEAEAGHSIPVTMLFAGFRSRVRDLAMVGGVNLMGNFALMLVLLAFGGDALMQFMSNPQALSPEDAIALENRLSGALVVTLALGVPLAMAVWFAPVAIALDGLSGGRALVASLRGVLRNSLPFVVYSFSLTGIGLMLFALQTATGLLGPGVAMEITFWVLMPLLVTSVYASYRDIYPNTTGLEPVVTQAA